MPWSSCVAPVGVEDKESWHGKPLPKNMADQIVQEIYGQIQSKKKIMATPPQEDAPAVDIANIRMPTPPSYKVGDKVLGWILLSWTHWVWDSSGSLPSQDGDQDVPSGGLGNRGEGLSMVRRTS